MPDVQRIPPKPGPRPVRTIASPVTFGSTEGDRDFTIKRSSANPKGLFAPEFAMDLPSVTTPDPVPAASDQSSSASEDSPSTPQLPSSPLPTPPESPEPPETNADAEKASSLLTSLQSPPVLNPISPITLPPVPKADPASGDGRGSLPF